MKPKRILFTSWYTGLGGGETDLLTLVEALDRTRFEPHLLLPAAGQLCERWRAAGWQAHIIPYRGASTWFVPALWARFPVVKRFRALLQAQKIDLIQSDYHTLPLMAPAAQSLGLPLTWVVWGWWFKPRRWQRNFFRSMPSAMSRSLVISWGFLGDPPFMPEERLPVIYPGLNTERFRPGLDGGALRRELGIAKSDLVVVMVARFQQVKGHHIFQWMAERVLAELPETQFIIAGDDVFGVAADKRYRDQVLAHAKSKPLLRERLHYIGFRHDVETVYAAGDVFVCPSDFESFGIAVVEAMACGRPVVSTRFGGPTETVLDGQTGFLVDPGDDAALAERVLELLRDAEMRLRFGANARLRAQYLFSPKVMAEEHSKIYEELLSLNSPWH